jgi:hypothetical protein
MYTVGSRIRLAEIRESVHSQYFKGERELISTTRMFTDCRKISNSRFLDALGFACVWLEMTNVIEGVVARLKPCPPKRPLSKGQRKLLKEALSKSALLLDGRM